MEIPLGVMDADFFFHFLVSASCNYAGYFIIFYRMRNMSW